MKYLLILTFTVLTVYASSSEENAVESFSVKEKIRLALVQDLEQITHFEIEKVCSHPLTPEQIVFSNEKLTEFVDCGNATIDKFIGKLDDHVIFNETGHMGELIRLYAEPACQLANEIFKCVGEFGPVIDLCLDDHQKIVKNKIFGIVPLMEQSLCVRTGTLISDIILHVDGIKCVTKTLEAMDHIDFVDLYESDSTVLFGNEKACQKGSVVLQEFYVKVGECSADVLAKVKDMLGYICERTPCNNHVHNLQCY